MDGFSQSLGKMFLVLTLTLPAVGAAASAMAGDKVHNITFVNYCDQTIWVGQDGTLRDGWEMKAQTNGVPTKVTRQIPLGFSGRWWPRTGCNFDTNGLCPKAGVNCCDTGGCKASATYFGLKCTGGGEPPASLFEPTFDAGSPYGPYDTYDLSLVDGFTVPMHMKPVDGTYNKKSDGQDDKFWCKSKGWTENPACPDFLWDKDKKVCYGPCAYYTKVKNVNSGNNKANICCDRTNVDPHGDPGKTCQHNDFIGGYGCSPIGPGKEEEKCYAKTPKKHGYWGDISDTVWPAINRSVEYITAVNNAVPGVYAWQFDDQNSTFNCRKTGGQVDYEITFCPPQ
jgi:hypothetical protein